MNKINMSLVLLTLFCTTSSPALADTKVDLSTDMVSSYVFRGATLNSGPALQPGVEVSGLPVSFGIWGNLDVDDNGGSLASGQFSEIDIYFSYDLPIDLGPVGLSIGYTEYTYPVGVEADREVSLTAALSDTVLSPSLAIYYGIDGAIEKSLYIEMGLGHEEDLGKLCAGLTGNLNVALGYMAPDTGDSGFSHADIGIGLGYDVFSASVVYVTQIDGDVLGSAYETEWFGKIGVACSF